MCIFRKRKTTDADIKENRRQIELMAGSFEMLKVLTTNEEVLNRINVLQEKVRYMNPTTNETALSLDKKIENIIGETKTSLLKIKSDEDYDKILKDFRYLEMLIEDRINHSRSGDNRK